MLVFLKFFHGLHILPDVHQFLKQLDRLIEGFEAATQAPTVGRWYQPSNI